jgi:hypothetical protein
MTIGNSSFATKLATRIAIEEIPEGLGDFSELPRSR